MRSSSTRLRIAGALAATSLTLVFGLGSTAFADQGQGEAHRNERASGAADRSRPADAGPPQETTPTEDTENNDGGSPRETTPTEDTDTNDGGTPNNVSDAGDDRHPSGKDRSVENGSSGNQGNAAAEPDQNDRGPERDNGGLDQPNGPGGADLADQDGNNGCGNDDDFEDDNEGRCRSPRAATPPPAADVETDEKDEENDAAIDGADAVTPGPVGGTQVGATAPAVEAQVLGVVIERPAVIAETVQVPVATPVVERPTSVLGATVVRNAPLARTGLGIGTLMLAAGVLLLTGFAMVRRPKGAHFLA